VKIRRGARAVLIDGEGDLLLMRRYKKGETYLTTVGGGIDPEDRSPEDAMRREVFEELGAVVGASPLIYVLTAPFNDVLMMQYFYLARVLGMNWDARTGSEYKGDKAANYQPYSTPWNADLAGLDLRPMELRDYLVQNAQALQELMG
jgi:8-oxo-dGTP pyrophosphatase MutT (NUDIX family)